MHQNEDKITTDMKELNISEKEEKEATVCLRSCLLAEAS
jgi:hypothetical protein